MRFREGIPKRDMKRLRPHRGGFLYWFCMTVLLGLVAMPAKAQELTVVMSSDLSPYIEALDGFREIWNEPFHRIDLEEGVAPNLPPETRIVVTIGGRAALASYPSDVVVVYCLAPGVTLDDRARQNRAVKVTMIPSASKMLTRLKVVQPHLRRLGVFWMSDAQASFLPLLDIAAQQWGVQVVSKRVGGMRDLPNGLREALRNGIDALWLPPDPALINPQSFGIFKAFSYANDVPLYVPSSGLLEKGAIASLSCDFSAVGQTAGDVAQRIIVGDQMPVVVYPERVTFWVNTKAALETGLKIDVDALIRNGGEVRE